MTVLAMLFMGAALLFVTGLAAWCYYQVLIRHRERSRRTSKRTDGSGGDRAAD